VLLILDNCEHLVAACARFCQAMLQACPHLTIMATSREALGVPGEVRWAVSSLHDSDALHLFEARARLVSPNFKIAPPNLQPVSDICDRLDRLPLAIEMAAARLDVMSERDVLSNLTDRFRVLASGTRTAPERQQTMSATIDWSYRLLTEDEARLFRGLSVFQGGFTFEGAQAVCADSGAGNVLGSLAALVQKSMVVADRLDDGGTRYRLLESHHAYATEKLRESAELDLVQRRHYEYFESKIWTARESANLWAALGWARNRVEYGGLGLAVKVADSEFTDPARARGMLLDLLERSDVQGSLHARARNLAARLASRQGDHLSARALADASVADARQLHDSQLVAQTLSGAGVVYHAANELGTARRMYDEALSLLKESRDRRLGIDVQNQLAILATEEGQYKEALAMLEECLSFSRAEASEATTAKYLESLANVELALGHVDRSARSWREALSVFRKLNDPFGTIWCIGGLALVASTRGDHDRALRLAAVVDRMSREWRLSAWSVRIDQLEEASGQARARLGARKAEAVWTEGLSMNAARSLEYALGEDRLEGLALDAGPLSRREREVASMVATGLTNKQIAERLFIAERTAEGHVERIRNKLGVRSRTEVATWAVAHGIASGNLDKPSPASTV
jgi:non-specific serine/threonine protein kinase